MEELIIPYGDTKSKTFFGKSINIWQRGPIKEHIQKFLKLSLKVKNIPNDNLLDLFMGNFEGKHLT